MKVIVIEIKHYQLKNFLIKLDYTKKYLKWSQKIRYVENPINGSN